MGQFGQREVGGAVVIDFGEDFGRDEFLSLEKQVAALVHGGRKYIALNLSKVPMMTSDGIGLLVPMHDRCEQAGGKLAVYGLNERALRVVKLASLDGFFNLFGTQQQAIAGLGIPKKGRPAKRVRSGRMVAPPKKDKEEARMRDLIHRVVRSRLHALVLERAAAKGAASIKKMASDLGCSPASVKGPFESLVAAGVLKPLKGEEYSFAPSDGVKADVAFFLKRWSDPDSRSRIAAWLLAEEKTGG